MSNVSKVLVREGIRKADCLEDKLTAVARAVSKHIDTIPEGILYEVEVAKALEELRKKKPGYLTQSDAMYLSKPAQNNCYERFGVKSFSLRDAIIFGLQELDSTKPIEVRYEGDKQGTMQQFSHRVILYKEDEKLKQYIRSRASLYPKVVYTFAVPDGLATVREGSLRLRAR